MITNLFMKYSTVQFVGCTRVCENEILIVEHRWYLPPKAWSYVRRVSYAVSRSFLLVSGF